MRTFPECLPCFLRQGAVQAQLVGADAVLTERLEQVTRLVMAKADLSQSPPELAHDLHEALRAVHGVADSFAAEKRQFNALALRLLPTLRRDVQRLADPLAGALRLAMAANLIDTGIHPGIDETQILAALEGAMLATDDGVDVLAFETAVAAAPRILYLADNTGEIVLDRLLLEFLPREKITVAVRGSAILNDALYEDAVTAGIDTLVPVISNGDDSPGTVLRRCSTEFRTAFDAADLIISKGQGNFETLFDTATHKNIIFLLTAKCPVVARMLNTTMGSRVLHCSWVKP